MTKETQRKQSAREKARNSVAKQQREDRKFKYMLWGIVAAVAVIAVVAIIVTIQNSEDTMTITEDRTPENITASSALQIPGDGNDNPDAVRVDYFFDPQCHACQTFSENAGDTVQEFVDSGAIDLHVHPVSFMGGNANNDYSGQAANAVVTVHEEAPEHTLDFVSAIYEEDFFPQGGPDTRTSDEISAQAIDAGIPENIAHEFTHRYYHDWVKSNTDVQMERSDFFPEGNFGTPAIFMNVGEENGDGTVDGDFFQLQLSSGSDMGQVFADGVARAQDEAA